MTNYNNVVVRIMNRYQTSNPSEEDLEVDKHPITATKPQEDPILRRLKKHIYYKAVIGCTTGSPIRRRVTPVTFTPDIDTGEQTNQTLIGEQMTHSPVEHRRDKSNITLKSLRDEINNLQKIPIKPAAQRESYKKSIDNMSDYVRWLQAKPIKSDFETRVMKKGFLEQLDADFNARTESEGNRNWYNFLQSNSHKGDKFVAQETVALHILDEYFHKNNEDMSSFLSNLDISKSGYVSWSVVLEALNKRNIYIELYELLQGLAVLQCFEDNELNYKKFCDRMDNFRNYKWSRLMSETENFSENLMQSLSSVEKNNPHVCSKRGFKRMKPSPRPEPPVLNLLSRKVIRKKQSDRPEHPEVKVKVKDKVKIKVKDKVKDKVKEKVKDKVKEKVKDKVKEKVKDKGKDKGKPALVRSLSDVEPPPKGIKRVFWPGTNLDKLQPCYMPLDRRHPDDRHHPLFEIIYHDKSAETPRLKLPPFINYTIYSRDRKI